MLDGDRIQTRNENYQNGIKRMLEAVMVKQATKAGFIKWQVGGGGGRSQLPNIKDQTRTRSGGWDRLSYDNVEQSGVVQVGA